MSVIVGDTFKPDDKVQESGIYDVRHDPEHHMRHQVPCVSGEPFPTCRTCYHGVRFRLAIAAIHVKGHKYFKGK
jgi:hypothetical protein